MWRRKYVNFRSLQSSSKTCAKIYCCMQIIKWQIIKPCRSPTSVMHSQAKLRNKINFPLKTDFKYLVSFRCLYKPKKRRYPSFESKPIFDYMHLTESTKSSKCLQKYWVNNINTHTHTHTDRNRKRGNMTVFKMYPSLALSWGRLLLKNPNSGINIHFMRFYAFHLCCVFRIAVHI